MYQYPQSDFAFCITLANTMQFFLLSCTSFVSLNDLTHRQFELNAENKVKIVETNPNTTYLSININKKRLKNLEAKGNAFLHILPIFTRELIKRLIMDELTVALNASYFNDEALPMKAKMSKLDNSPLFRNSYLIVCHNLGYNIFLHFAAFV